MGTGIAFIACSKTKASEPCAAWKMYQGSLFTKALAYCLPRYSQVYILSAKYGIVGLYDIISPYEKTLNTASKKEREEWSQMVKTQMMIRELFGEELWFYTGVKYNEFFEGHKPLAGLSLGFQLQWFDNHA